MGQDKDSTTGVWNDAKKLKIDKELFNSDATKKSFDESYMQILQFEPASLKIDVDSAAKMMMLQQFQQKSIIDAGAKETNGGTITIVKKAKDGKTGIIESDKEIVIKRLHGPSQFDSRIELQQLDVNTQWQFELIKKSQSVAMIVEKENLHQLSNDVYVLDVSQTLGAKYGLCRDEPYSRQPSSGIGTAFIFSKNSMLTAGHVFERPITDYVIVFGFKILVSSTLVPDNYFYKKDIYFPQAVVKKDDELDIVEFIVNKDFDRPVLEWEKSSDIKKESSEIYMIGHPSGIPTKVALNAGIEEDSHPFYFYTSLDSFQGNSGSPVFNLHTNNVIGILTAGETDYKFNGNCYYSPVCRLPYCKGEKVVRIEKVVEHL
ncbi:serine protease [Flavobacterium sp. SLB02]|uniref:trypsin-like serine peptidase n=1 Tax=Flavobacterium sp. SLB02 TaxID=2665645 RepID=UPI001ABF7486|nr:serine protease [Flavobacterium sp. SLB02]